MALTDICHINSTTVIISMLISLQ